MGGDIIGDVSIAGFVCGQGNTAFGKNSEILAFPNADF